ncbi:MAG: arsenate reductase ArsC [Gammaproteobacteria bacterium]|jgi:arsenate reductase|nr:arsenate reductase ArsC [Xanthomonadales bacterium]
MYKVLFLCTGNSCRSILAEAILNHYGQPRFQAYSAGSQPTGQVNPDSLAVLEKFGLSNQGFKSQSWDEFSEIDFDIVITVCDNAANETCPLYLGKAIKVHWGLPDPDKVVQNRYQAFEDTFVRLKYWIEQLIGLQDQEMNQKNIQEIIKE